MSAAHRADRVEAWKPSVPGVSEVFHARFVEHAYPRHVHDTWTLFIVDDGEIRYGLDRHLRGARRSMVSVLPPHVMHDGRPATSRGYRKRVLYLEPEVIGEDLVGAAVDTSYVEDAALRRGVARLHTLLRHPGEELEAESLLALVASRVVRHLRGRSAVPARDADTAELAARLRDLLDARAFQTTTLAAAGAALGASPAHLVRTFTRSFGMPPHAYVISRRIEAARARLLDGEPIAGVAAGVGFFDQAHLTRHFIRHVGTTPGRFARAGRASGAALRALDEPSRARERRSAGRGTSS